MQFKVPQFLDIEDKIFGPFTFKEFAYLAGGAGMCFVFYKLLGLFLSIIPMLLMAAISFTLIFYRPNGKPLVNMLGFGFKYFTKSKLYIWEKGKGPKKETVKPSPSDEEKIRNVSTNRLNASKLRDLAWSLDILDLSKQKNIDS